MRQFLYIFILLFISNIASSQYSMDAKIENFSQIDETTIQWEVWIKKSTGSNDFAYYGGQFTFQFDNDVLNTGKFVTSFFTIEGGENMTQYSGFFKNEDAVVTGSAPNQYFNWASSSPPNVGQSQTIISDTWIKFATFQAQLRKGSDDGVPHNFEDMDPEFAFHLTAANIASRDVVTGSTYSGNNTPITISNFTPAKGVAANDRQLAGYWFSGDGHWSETGRWNNVTTENANTLPGANSNAIINGNCTIAGTKASYSLLPDGNGNGGELTVLTGEEPLFEFDVEINGDGNQTVTIYTQDPFQEITLPANLPAGTKLWLNTDDNTPPPPPFPTFLGWHYPGQGYFSTQAEWVDYTMPSQNTLVIADWSTGSKTIIKQKESRNTLYASLTIAPGASLTVDKLFNDNENGNQAIVVQSTATGSGSLIHNNTGVEATVERYINRWSEKGVDHGWHFLSSPVASQAIRPEFVPDVNPIPEYIDFYKWDESYEDEGVIGWWINSKDASFNWNTSFEDDFVVGRGYLMAYGTPEKEYGDKAHLFQGAVNVENVSLTSLTNTPNSTHRGWHLVGNPYSSAIDWNQGSWTKTNIGSIPQIWNESSASYTVLSDGTSNIIPAHNGFMVYTPGSGAITIPADSRVHSSTPWYKSGSSEHILLTANDSERGTMQETIIRFNPDATGSFDLEYDATFIPGFAPMFYSVSDGKLFALNTLPQHYSELEIPMGFVKNNSEIFSIEVVNSIPDVPLYLHDLKLNIVHNMSKNPVYTFTSKNGDDPNRFVLKFGMVSISDVSSKEAVSWYSDGYLFYRSSGETNISFTDLTGRTISVETTYGSGLQTLPVNLPKGVFIAVITNGGQSQIIKLIIQ